MQGSATHCCSLQGPDLGAAAAAATAHRPGNHAQQWNMLASAVMPAVLRRLHMTLSSPLLAVLFPVIANAGACCPVTT